MADDPLLGTLLGGRLQLEAVLGIGGMGKVYLARHVDLNRYCAVKLIHQQLITDPEIEQRFMREARVASRIEHPHIISIFDFGKTENGEPYLVMEYAKGKTLAETIETTSIMPRPRAVAILLQIADALAAAHAADVIHRDLKPHNVILMQTGSAADNVKILDFGLAKMLGPETMTMLSMHGMACGTPWYMSPEQCQGNEVDARTDIYSFGVLAFELLAGHVPFDGSIIEIVRGHLQEEPPTLSNLANVPPELEALVLRCLAKQREERFPHGAALVRELRNLQDFLEEEVTTAAAGLPLLELSSQAGALVAVDPLGTAKTMVDFVLEGTGTTATSAEWFVPLSAVPSAMSHRRRLSAVNARVYDLRDHGIGSAEITLELANKVHAEDQLLALSARYHRLEQQIAVAEEAANTRELRLRRLLAQLERERAHLQQANAEAAAVPAPGRSQPEPPDGTARELAAQLEQEIRDTIDALRRVVAESGGELSSLRAELQQLYSELTREQEKIAVLEQHLLELLWDFEGGE